MRNFQTAILAHMATYARRRLGVFEHGTYKRGADTREYAHILPVSLRYLNLLEWVRAELQDYLNDHPSIKLHKYFHHLNSSQAFALNLFYPYFAGGGYAARALTTALRTDGEMVELSWEFEQVGDELEGTNVDVAWRTSDRAWVFCEVKFSEGNFGSAKIDARHRSKLLNTYRPRLKPFVSRALLEETTFFKNYQLLRNIWLLAENVGHQLVVLFPRENELLGPPLRNVLDGVDPDVKARIKTAYVEDCLKSLRENPMLTEELRIHASNLTEKYVL